MTTTTAATTEDQTMTPTESTTPFTDATKAALDNILEFTYDCKPREEAPGGAIFNFGINAAQGNYNFVFDVREESGQFLIHGTSPIKIPQDKRDAVAEFLTRANYGIIIGSFDMDLRDGEVRVRVAQHLAHGGVLTKEAVVALFHLALGMLNRYFPGIMVSQLDELS